MEQTPSTSQQDTAHGEFSVRDAYVYNQRNALRWIISHVWRYRRLFGATMLLYLVAWSMFSVARVLTGVAAEEIINPTTEGALLGISLAVLLALSLDGFSSLGGSLSVETIAQRFSRDAREELYISLLGKSQTFHDRQRVGDVMARATNDIDQLNFMMNPGVLFIAETILGLAVPIITIATLNYRLMLVPLLFVGVYILTVRSYSRRLDPVVRNQRESFGVMNARLEETISGIEVVKASAQEQFERDEFKRNARRYRDHFAQQGRVEATYLPALFYGFALGLTFLHGMYLFSIDLLTIPSLIAVMALVAAMRFPVFISIFSFSLVQLGFASADRILSIINATADMGENVEGHAARVEGEITFENVTFGFDEQVILRDLNFTIKPGETVAIVGQTGSGKSTLTELINRTYEASQGRVLIDGVDVREWSLTSLRSQISRIEQDVFLFSRSIAENIAFGAPDAAQEQIEQAAREAQAHDFILGFKDGYQTEIGERGVTLSGGQRQRLALARAFLSDPRILILDDSTSAIDSATEDEIQKAIRRAQQGRTTLLITHRLSQIRWADHILVLEDGRVAASGQHDDLLRTSSLYRRIFSRYEAALPPVTDQQIAGD